MIPSGPMASAGMSWPLMEAAHHATNAAVSIIPSMPMLTTPERSFMKPHSAPSAIGTRGSDDRRRDDRQDVDEVADELEEIADEREVVEEFHRLYFAVCSP